MQILENESFRLKIEEKGAQLRSFTDKRGGQEYEHMWPGSKAWVDTSPLLFPIVGNLRGGVYRAKGREYRLKGHGFARYMPFAVQRGEDALAFTVCDTPDSRELYPWAFQIKIEYTLTAGGYTVAHTVSNPGDEDMYFSLGAHPGFNCQMGDRVVMDEEETADAFRLDAEGLRRYRQPVFRASREVEITPQIFAEDALMFTGLRSRGATLVRADGRNVHVDFGGAPCLGLWAAAGQPYVCIEPLYGIADRCDAEGDFTQKEYIQRLAPGEEFRFVVAVDVQGV